MANVDQNSPAFMLWCVEGDGKDARYGLPLCRGRGRDTEAAD